ncbi:hypothetical protein BDV93DRAFT_507920 [Ceratobasidium sp. AG-I]|nr:hypothetical protein BDV93DRAFT_507920 [Ceratobasidium sp. AG-I]
MYIGIGSAKGARTWLAEQGCTGIPGVRPRPSAAALGWLAKLHPPVRMGCSPPDHGLPGMGAMHQGKELPHPPSLTPTWTDKTPASGWKAATTCLGGTIPDSSSCNSTSHNPSVTSRTAVMQHGCLAINWTKHVVRKLCRIPAPACEIPADLEANCSGSPFRTRKCGILWVFLHFFANVITLTSDLYQ